MGNISPDTGLPESYPFKPEYELTPKYVHDAVAQNRVLLIDCRTREEFDFVHVPGSVHIPLDEIERRADEVVSAPGQEVAVICHHGVRSMRAALALRALGQPRAMSVAGGIDAWSQGVDPGIKRYERSGSRVWGV
jgi:rhodanese-related sulfurtransferase